MNILAIETSCDETAAAVVASDNGRIAVRSNVISSQIALHAQWGGVVPNLAAREHVANLPHVIEQALAEAKVTKDDIDLLAVTHGPGLIPALLVGVNAAKTLAYIWQKPLLGIHHIVGHIYANFIGNSQLDIGNWDLDIPSPSFPLLALVVSGGHTQLVLMRGHFDFEIIGQTQDDAVGEAFDKAARILGLGYPGGPEIAKRADAFDARKAQYGITLPHPMRNGDHYDFSFSGLKTAVLYAVKDFRKAQKLAEDAPLPEDFVNEFAWAFQQKAVEVLLHKTRKAMTAYTPQSVILAGGVSANLHLRSELAQLIAQDANTTLHIPDLPYCLDNAAMIAATAAIRWETLSEAEQKATQQGWKTVQAQARMSYAAH